MKTSALIGNGLLCFVLFSGTLLPGSAWSKTSPGQGDGYVANKDGIKLFFDALSARLARPIIVSKLAARKQISGEFDLSNPQALLGRISQQMALIWYDDGQTVYIYDASEMRNVMLPLRNISFAALKTFLQTSNLYDARYPLRGESVNNLLYLSGPPVYVELVQKAIHLMDEPPEGELEREQTAVIPLSYSFVGDRTYTLRGDKITIPGVARVIEQLMAESEKMPAPVMQPPPPAAPPPALPPFSEESAELPWQARATLKEALHTELVLGPVRLIANPGTNSLLVKGSGRQVQFVRNLVSALDTPKRHVELSLWIIDLQKSDLDQFGINWQGGVDIGGKLGVSLNHGSYSALDGARFVASVLALEQKNRANIVSRPIILTQENMPAIFDNNRTFYTRLLGERSVELREVTYGTMISVLPRFSGNGQVEMTLNIEDGSEVRHRDEGNTDSLPEVGRTHISTVARVPRGKSLLIGGYTRDEFTAGAARIPGLGSLPMVGGLFRYRQDKQSNTVRIFLIQPREITEPLQPNASEFARTMVAKEDTVKLQDWARNYLDSQQWQP